MGAVEVVEWLATLTFYVVSLLVLLGITTVVVAVSVHLGIEWPAELLVLGTDVWLYALWLGLASPIAYPALAEKTWIVQFVVTGVWMATGGRLIQQKLKDQEWFDLPTEVTWGVGLGVSLGTAAVLLLWLMGDYLPGWGLSLQWETLGRVPVPWLPAE